MDTKTAEFLSNLMLDDDEEDIVRFAFPNQKRKIKCFIPMLKEISPVFEAMFSARWRQENVADDINQPDQSEGIDTASQVKIIQLNDDVKFDQFAAFKLLMQILYGLKQLESLTVDQATDVYFYSHKYQIKEVNANIQKLLNERMESGMSNLPLSVAELSESVGFAQLYNLDEFKYKLDNVILAFDEDNPIQFWDLALKSNMKSLQEQVVDHVKAIAPNKDWPLDLLLAIIGRLQFDTQGTKKCVNCRVKRSMYCGKCA